MSIIRFLTKQTPTNGWYLKELSIAGLKPDDPETLFILEIMQVIKKHTDTGTFSKWYDLDICKQLMYCNPITPIDNPTQTGEYIAHSGNTWQSTRLGSVFSQDGGIQWYDIDYEPWFVKLARFIARRFKKTPKFLQPYVLYYIKEFPYKPYNDKFLNN